MPGLNELTTNAIEAVNALSRAVQDPERRIELYDDVEELVATLDAATADIQGLRLRLGFDLVPDRDGGGVEFTITERL